MRRAGVGSVDRRDLVRGGGAIALDALIAVPMSSQAQQPPVSIPVVDRLAVRVLVDSYQIAVAPSFKIDNVQVERFGWPLSDAPPDKALVCEFGLSMHLESRKGDQTRNVLGLRGAMPRTIFHWSFTKQQPWELPLTQALLKEAQKSASDIETSMWWSSLSSPGEEGPRRLSS
jgi:hypothetical protein